MTTPAMAPVAVPAHPTALDLRAVPDEVLLAECRRREEIERNFAWSVTLLRDWAVWESESGRARKITDWHARQIAERLCAVFGIGRDEFARRLIANARPQP